MSSRMDVRKSEQGLIVKIDGGELMINGTRLVVQKGNTMVDTDIPTWLAEEMNSVVRQKYYEITPVAIPDYGDLMKLEEFIEACINGSFVDTDGSGNYANETKMYGLEIKPSDVLFNRIQEGFTHVVWFNK